MALAAVSDIPRVPWRSHIAMMNERWEPGEHCSIIASTGQGKSRLTFGRRGLMSLWEESPRSLTLDIKGDDIEVQRGEPVQRIPGGRQRTLKRALSIKQDHYEHYRLVIPRIVFTEKASAQRRAEAQELIREALEWAYQEGDCVVNADEFRALTDPVRPRLGLASEFEDLYERARYRNVTIIAGTQGPRYVPSSFYDAPTYLYIAKFRDKRTRLRLREIGGDTEHIDAAMMGLGEYEFLFVADKGDTMQVVKHGR